MRASKISQTSLFALIVRECCAQSPSIGATLSYQVHSYNDIREWPQIFTKGSIYLKIDPQYAPALFCITQSRTNHSDPRGCLLLNHDDLTLLRPGYNTTDDVVAFIADPSNAAFFRNPAERKIISLCFKGCGGLDCPCTNSTLTSNWLSLVDDLYTSLNDAIQSNGLNVEILLDGDGNPGASKCLNQRWRPWNSVYISGGDPPEGFIDNNATEGWDRLQVLNEPTDKWAFAVNNSFGKFVNSTYTYILWEPSDQADILHYADMYIDKGLLHEPGFRYAINIDIAQWETYAGSRTGRAWDAVVIPANATGPAGGMPSSPTLVILPFPSSPIGGPVQLGVVLWNEAGQGAVQYSLRGFNNTGDPWFPMGSGVLPDPFTVSADCQISSASPLTFANGTVVVAVSASCVQSNLTTLALLSVGADVASLNIAAVFQYPLELGPVVAAASAISTFGTSGTSGDIIDVCYVTVLVNDPDASSSCAIYATITTFVSGGATASACLVLPSSTLGSVSPGNISVSLASFGNSDSGVTIAIAVVYAAGGMVYGASACYENESGVFKVNDPTCGGDALVTHVSEPAGATLPLPLWPGARPSISVLALSPFGSVSVMTAHGAGYCANNEVHNKFAPVGFCDQVPTTGSGGAYLNYGYGMLDAWTASLLAAGASGVYAGTPCSTVQAAGMFGMGAGPAPALYLSASSSEVRAGVMYEGLGSAVDPLSCGAALSSPGDLRLAGWPLAQPFFVKPA